jgi:hypothetical protein
MRLELARGCRVSLLTGSDRSRSVVAGAVLVPAADDRA